MNLKEAREAINTHAVKDFIEFCPHCGARAHIETLWNECYKLRNCDVEFYVVFRCFSIMALWRHHVERRHAPCGVGRVIIRGDLM